MKSSRERDRFSNRNMSKNKCQVCQASTTGTPYVLCSKCLAIKNHPTKGAPMNKTETIEDVAAVRAVVFYFKIDAACSSMNPYIFQAVDSLFCNVSYKDNESFLKALFGDNTARAWAVKSIMVWGSSHEEYYARLFGPFWPDWCDFGCEVATSRM